MLRKVGYSFSVDWWALGILTYDMIATVQPFYDDDAIREGDIVFPPYMSTECRDFVSKLLAKDPASRLGSNGGCDEVLAHPWLSGIDHQQIYEK